MNEGFFRISLPETKQQLRLPQCGACGIYKQCKSPKMKPYGKGKKKILIIGEAPGENEDIQNRQFIGKAGQELRRYLTQCGIDADEDCWMTNALICRPPNNRTPTNREIDYCRPNLINTVEELKPRVIIPLGGAATQSLISWVWKDDPGELARWIGWQIPCQKLNAWICPNYHPSYLLRENNELRNRFFLQDLERACKKTKRPWNKVPDWQSRVQIFRNPDKAAEEIYRLVNKAIRTNTPLAFDYETSTLKPDDLEASWIACCSISDGKTSIAYPWCGAAVDASIAFITDSQIPKYLWNGKFEFRYTKRVLGVEVANPLFDGMLGTHTLDNRKGTKGLKFQAFVRLGMESYDDEIKQYLKSSGPNKPNRIKEAPLDKLLLYCGLDSLLEAKLDKYLMRKIGL